MTKEINNWAVVFESSSTGMYNQVQAMIEKMTKNLARYYDLRMKDPNV